MSLKITRSNLKTGVKETPTVMVNFGGQLTGIQKHHGSSPLGVSVRNF